MLSELVVDTNVWVNGGNPKSERYPESSELIRCLLEGTTRICIDPGFSAIEADNRSIMGHEYLTHVRWVGSSFEILVTLLLRGQFRVVPSEVDDGTRTAIASLVANTRDRHFLSLTYNSHDRILASHDYEDFSAPTREEIGNQIHCTVAAADEVVPLLTA